MSKAQFIEQASAGALPLHAVTVHGVAFFVTETSALDIRYALGRTDAPKAFTIERRLAPVMLAADGRPIFDPESDEALQELRVVLDRLPGSFPKDVHAAKAVFDKPITEEEVDSSGN
jgi:hypothetical protein